MALGHWVEECFWPVGWCAPGALGSRRWEIAQSLTPAAGRTEKHTLYSSKRQTLRAIRDIPGNPENRRSYHLVRKPTANRYTTGKKNFKIKGERNRSKLQPQLAPHGKNQVLPQLISHRACSQLEFQPREQQQRPRLRLPQQLEE